MAANEVVPGPISRQVAENVRRLRGEQRLSQAQLAAELEKAGRHILATGLHRLESGRRRIDVDDLVGLAAAFKVSPITLLMPFTAEGSVQLTDQIQVDAERAWRWLQARMPLDADAEDHFDRADFQRRALPKGIRSYPPGPAGRRMAMEDGARVRMVDGRELDLSDALEEGGSDGQPDQAT